MTKETPVFKLEMFANSPIKPLLEIPSGHCLSSGAVCDNGQGMLRICSVENWFEPLSQPDVPEDQMKVILLMLIPTIERADALICTLQKIKEQMRGWQAKQECRAVRDKATRDAGDS